MKKEEEVEKEEERAVRTVRTLKTHKLCIMWGGYFSHYWGGLPIIPPATVNKANCLFWAPSR